MHHQIIKSAKFFNIFFVPVFAALDYRSLTLYFYYRFVISLVFITRTKLEMR